MISDALASSRVAFSFETPALALALACCNVGDGHKGLGGGGTTGHQSQTDFIVNEEKRKRTHNVLHKHGRNIPSTALSALS